MVTARVKSNDSCPLKLVWPVFVLIVIVVVLLWLLVLLFVLLWLVDAVVVVMFPAPPHASPPTS